MDLYQRIQLYTKEIQHFISAHPYGQFCFHQTKAPKKK